MNWIIEQTADLKSGGSALQRVQPVKLLASEVNSNAHVWSVKVSDQNGDADLTGVTVMGYFVNKDGSTVMVTGSATGNTATVVFPAAVYAVPGLVKATMEISVEDSYSLSVASMSFVVQDNMTDEVIDPDSFIAETVEQLVDDAIDALATEVQQGIAHIDGLVATLSGEITGTTLYNISDDGIIEYNTAKSIHGSFSDYEYLEVIDLFGYVTHLDVDTILASSDNKTAYIEKTWTSNTSFESYFIGLKFGESPDTVTVYTCSKTVWDGTSSHSASQTTGSTAASDIGFGGAIKQIIGYKHTEDVELADARVGADGTVFQTAGAAIRGQISAITGNNLVASVTATSGKCVRYDTGTRTSQTGMSYKTVSVAGISTIVYSSVRSSSSSTKIGMAFYDANDGYVSGQKCQIADSSSGFIMRAIDVPEGAATASFSWRDSLDTAGYALCVYDKAAYDLTLAGRVFNLEQAAQPVSLMSSAPDTDPDDDER